MNDAAGTRVSRKQPHRLANLVWLFAYFLMIGAVIAAAFYGRHEALAVYGSAEAQTEWNTWRDDAQKMAEEPAIVKRRAPESREPPALVLMRDHFAVCLTIGVVLSSVLFGTLMVFVRGALAGANRSRKE